MIARELMKTPVVTIHHRATLDDLAELLQREHVNGVPVVDDHDLVIGMVTEEDVLYGSMGSADADETGPRPPRPSTVRDIMTSPVVSATSATPVEEICRLMWGFRIHRIPILKDGKAIGIVSALDLVRAVADGRIKA